MLREANKEERKAKRKAWIEAHKEEIKAYKKAWNEAHKEQINAYQKAYQKANKEELKAICKAYYQANKEEHKARCKAWSEAHRQESYEYKKSDVNSFGESKHSIRNKSRQILKQMNLHIPGYEIHHCFTYDDPSKFIYISKSLHLKIHAYLREHNIDAGKDHWMQIRDIVNSADEFTYIKC